MPSVGRPVSRSSFSHVPKPPTTEPLRNVMVTAIVLDRVERTRESIDHMRIQRHAIRPGVSGTSDLPCLGVGGGPITGLAWSSWTLPTRGSCCTRPTSGCSGPAAPYEVTGDVGRVEFRAAGSSTRRMIGSTSITAPPTRSSAWRQPIQRGSCEDLRVADAQPPANVRPRGRAVARTRITAVITALRRHGPIPRA